MSLVIRKDPETGEEYPQSVRHSEPKLKVLGDPNIVRQDAHERVTGKAKFAGDIILPGMLYGKVLKSPYAHAKIKSIDTSKAEALPGVKAVLTFKDVGTYVLRAPDHYILSDVARYVGDEIAAVAAVDEDTAEEALSLIKVEYEKLPFVIDGEEAMKPDAPKIRGESNVVGGKPVTFKRGDVDKGFAEADTIVEDKYRTPLQQHAPIESRTAVAFWEGDRLTVWGSNQGAYGWQSMIADALKMPRAMVRFTTRYSCVGFGDKGSAQRQGILAALLAKKAGAPVKIQTEVDTNFVVAVHRHPSIMTIKVGVKKDGTLTAIKVTNICNNGAYTAVGASGMDELHRWVYKCPNLLTEGYDVYVNTPVSGALRCVGHPYASAMMEIHMDRVAEALGMDPYEFRVKNGLTGQGVGADQDFPKMDLSTNPHVDCLKKGAEIFKWKDKWKGWKTPVEVKGSKRRGIGVAAHTCRHGYLANPMSAIIIAKDDGTFNLMVGTSDPGTGGNTAWSIMAAEELGVPATSVWCTSNDTDVCAEGVGAGGSRTVRAIGTAAIVAAVDVKKQLFTIAAPLLKVKPEELDAGDSKIYVKADPTKSLTMKEVCARQSTVTGPIIGRGANATKKPNYHSRQGAPCFAEVEVDIETGEAKVLNLVMVSDIGRIVFYKGAVNQVFGAEMEALGRALFEGQVLDKGTGATLNPNFLDYKIASITDLPEQTVDFIEAIDPYGPYGAKGVGEPPDAAPQAAIANAIYNATGVRINEYPITPDKILKALGKA